MRNRGSHCDFRIIYKTLLYNILHSQKILALLERCDNSSLRNHTNRMDVFKFDDIYFSNSKCQPGRKTVSLSLINPYWCEGKMAQARKLYSLVTPLIPQPYFVTSSSLALTLCLHLIHPCLDIALQMFSYIFQTFYCLLYTTASPKAKTFSFFCNQLLIQFFCIQWVLDPCCLLNILLLESIFRPLGFHT